MTMEVVLEYGGLSVIAGFWMLGAALMVFVMILLFPILVLIGGRRLFQKYASTLAQWYWGYMTGCVENWGRCQMKFSGDQIPMRENALIMSNHRWGVDWMMILCFAARKGMMGVTKLFAKDSVKWIPGIGWGIWLLDFPFLARDWVNDAKVIDNTFHNLRHRGLPFYLVSHLEGTRLTPKKLKRSQEFAKKKDLPVMDNVLLPRTKGFVTTIQALRQHETAKAVYDITIVYNDGRKAPSLADILYRRGGIINMHVRRWKMESLPTDDTELAAWILQRWTEKNELIQHLLDHGEFPDRYELPYKVEPLIFE